MYPALNGPIVLLPPLIGIKNRYVRVENQTLEKKHMQNYLANLYLICFHILKGEQRHANWYIGNF
ncbi:hypothetical protein DES34_102177 [Brevibacillus brevis]|nr:hypothetical protein C7J99_28780 [Brevibacillus brevis]RED34012.1 hypothetical protein DES34_102177 [Brevibacillus brevis]GEC89519.1 hypothetical protein BBR01nite_18500 [Brevibacillus brevis]VEF92418.1 Uncharacterised protein [Brevibacillus brevis]